MLTVPKDHIKDYLDWVKNLVTICAAAVGALLYKDDLVSLPGIKWSALLFVVAMVCFVIAYTGLISHRDTTADKMRKLGSVPLLLGWLAFLAAFGFSLARFFL